MKWRNKVIWVIKEICLEMNNYWAKEVIFAFIARVEKHIKLLTEKR